MLQRLFIHAIAVTFSTFGTRYGIRIRVAGMKILSPRPLDEPSLLLSVFVKAASFSRSILIAKDICYISYSCMFVVTSLSSQTLTGDNT